MSITFFGVIWIFFTIFIFLRRKVNEMVQLLMIAMVLQQPAVIRIGDSGIGPQIITSCAFIIWFFYYILSARFGRMYIGKFRGIKQWSVLGCVLMLICIAVSLMYNGNSSEIENFSLYIIQLCVYILCFALLWDIRRLIAAEVVKKLYINTIEFVAVVGLIQFINTSGIINLNTILRIILYNSTDMGLCVGDVNYPWSMPRLYATFQEPSYCAAFLIGAFYFLIAYGMKSKKEIALTLLILLEILMTFSSTAYGAFAICGFLYLVISGNKKALRILVPIAVVAFVVLAASGKLAGIWNDVIVIKLDPSKSGSAWERNLWNERALAAFADSQMIGIGYKNCRASYIVFSILGQLGILGLCSWLLIWTPCFLKGIRNRRNEDAIALTMLLLGVICSMLIAIPDIDFCIFWLAMYMVALFSNENFKNKRVRHENISNYTSI